MRQSMAKKVHAASVSNIVKIAAIIFMVAAFFLTDKAATDIITIGLAISAVFLPIDVNKTIKNIKQNEKSISNTVNDSTSQ